MTIRTKAHRRGRVNAVAVGGLLVLGLLLWWAVTWMSGPPRLKENQGREIATAFLAEIRRGNVDAAWEGTSAEFKSLLGLEGMRTYVKKHPGLKKEAEFTREAKVESNGLSLAEVVFREPTGGAEVKVLLAPEGGTWKVERLVADGK